MADPVLKPTNTGPDAAELFVADRQKFWTSFTTFATGACIAIVALLIAMAIFLT